MTPYVETPDIPEGMSIRAYRAIRAPEPMRPRRGILKRATRAAVRSAGYPDRPTHRQEAV